MNHRCLDHVIQRSAISGRPFMLKLLLEQPPPVVSCIIVIAGEV